MKKLYRYLPPFSRPSLEKGEAEDSPRVEAICAQRVRGHRIKVMPGLYLRGGEAMLLDEEFVSGIPHLYEVNTDGSKVGDKYSRPDATMEVSVPDDQDGKNAKALRAIRERAKRLGANPKKSTVKSGKAAADLVKAALAADKAKSKAKK